MKASGGVYHIMSCHVSVRVYVVRVGRWTCGCVSWSSLYRRRLAARTWIDCTAQAFSKRLLGPACTYTNAGFIFQYFSVPGTRPGGQGGFRYTCRSLGGKEGGIRILGGCSSGTASFGGVGGFFSIPEAWGPLWIIQALHKTLFFSFWDKNHPQIGSDREAR